MRPLALLLILALSANARQPVRARQAMVVAQEPHAAEVGLRVLKNGGNAVDAAIAVAFALAVTLPSAGNIGGGGFMVIRQPDGTSAFVDFRERAPLKASRDMYLKDGKLTIENLVGWRAAGVPGTVRGMELARRKFGSKSWPDLIQPAVELAAKGFPVSYAMSESLKSAGRLAPNTEGTSALTRSGVLAQFPDSRRIFLRDGRFFEPGELLVQAELAATLKRIQRGGADEFYQGETARRIATAMQKNRGLISLEDLKSYRAVEREPLKGVYKGYEIVTAAPPSSGGVGLLHMLGILEHTGFEKHGAGSAAGFHYLAEAMRRFYADRGQHLGDPDFVKVPLRGLLNSDYIARRRASIQPDRATPSSDLGHGDLSGYESLETTHYAVVDAAGAAVAVTYTLNGGFGSGVTVPGTGILLNNNMDNFASQVGGANAYGLIQGEANAIQPGKRPVSSMTPTIVSRDGKLVLVIGAPGGTRITTAVMQALLNVLDHKMNVQAAIDAPRIHHQWMPDQIFAERGLSPDTLDRLERMGHKVERASPVGALVVGIHVETDRLGRKWLAGGWDGRRGDGLAVGW
ncbi:MAG: gamma-glutamyltransferase [Bryobacteraceae bacterium]|nr:gamma-glutamyltransferase [Bryobacteraceae bacterium]